MGVSFCTSVSLHLCVKYIEKDLKFLYICKKKLWFPEGVFLHRDFESECRPCDAVKYTCAWSPVHGSLGMSFCTGVSLHVHVNM